jgi:thiol-disulfide isomerase/thioredoxin
VTLQPPPWRTQPAALQPRGPAPGNAAPADALPWLASAAWAVLATVALAFAPWRFWQLNGGAALSIHVGTAAAGALALAAARAWAPGPAGWSRPMALGGAWALLVSSALRALDAWGLAPGQGPALALAYEAPSWLAALAVLAALRIDEQWRSSHASAVVLPLVVAALLADLWLMSGSHHLLQQLRPALDGTLQWAWHLGGKAGVAACLGLGLWCGAGLWARQRGLVGRAEARPAQQHRPVDHARWLHAAMVLGLGGFTLAALSALALAVLHQGDAALQGQLLAGASVWLGFGLPFWWWRWRGSQALVRWVVLGLALALAGYLGAPRLAGALASAGWPTVGSAAEAESWPALPLRTLSDQPFSPAALGAPAPQVRGTPPPRLRVLNLWARWCAPCRRELPALQRLAARLAPAQAEVLTIAIDDEPFALREYVLGLGLQLPVLRLASADAAAWPAAASLPQTFVLGPGNQVLLRLPGARDWDDPAVQQLLLAAGSGRAPRPW